MKPFKLIRKRPVAMGRQMRGFALIVTLSLMILLTVIAVGLLTLSSISLRTSGQGSAMATARANAQLALILAIGDLQKAAGPDQRVTARADILGEDVANPRLTGIWDSWEIKSTTQASDYDKSSRDSRFRGWLVSGNPQDTVKIGFASTAAPSTTAAARSSAGIQLWGKGTLGDNPFSKSIVTATKVTIGSTAGALAWGVMDEGVKVRINTPYRETPESVGAKVAQLGAGQVPNVSSVSGADPGNGKDERPLKALAQNFFEENSPEYAEVRKGITRVNFQLAGDQIAAGTGDKLKSLTHDVTVNSAGLFTDVARGGFKADFDLLTSTDKLPSKYAGQGVYVSRGVMPSKQASDPSWESLGEFARIYREKVNVASGVPVIQATAPSGWQAATSTTTASTSVTTLNLAPPPGVVLMPTIAKVQLLFGLIGRDMYSYTKGGVPNSSTSALLHGPQDAYFRGTRYVYDLHLLYTPVVSLHNPYNVAIQFTRMNLEFVRVPFAMQIFRNGQPQSKELIPLEKMYGSNLDGKKDKTFGITLRPKTASGGLGSPYTPITLLPGEVKMFSAYIDPKLTYASEVTKYGGGAQSWDANFENNITQNISAIPGWRGNGLGFDADQLTGDQFMEADPFGAAAKLNGHWKSSICFGPGDQFHVLFAPLGTKGKNKFTIKMSANLGSSKTPTTVGAIEMNYESDTGLQDTILGKNQTLRFPKDSSEFISWKSLIDHSTTPYGSLVGTKPIALLSVQAKSTSGLREGSIIDGRVATKPWAFAHANIGASSQKVVSEKSANHSHEIDLQVLDNSGTDNLLSIDTQDRTNFITGHSSYNGTKFGAQYEIPVTPIQTFAGLNGANPGGSSGYLPRVAQPIGNSWAHPLMSTSRMLESKGGTNYLDHSFLLNLALYDGFYFSGLASQNGPFGSGLTTETLATAVTDNNYANPTAGIGPSYQGAPGFLTQADLLNVLGNAATARSDTFTIRGYGEARDASGKITASATCEAVVQRYPEWVSPADALETPPSELTSSVNKNFGRRFVVSSFRWLTASEM